MKALKLTLGILLTGLCVGCSTTHALIDAPATPEPQAPGVYDLPLAEGQSLRCALAVEPETPVRCQANFPTTWKFTDGDHRQAAQVLLQGEPPEVRAHDQLTLPEDASTIAGGQVTSVGPTRVDLTKPGEAVISVGDVGVRITPDSYERVGPAAI
ncbi:hypothetical protein QVA66_10895 [Staphylococcus chromogenes]|nr:hypothetical protein [Staphylococcus chromogenes]